MKCTKETADRIHRDFIIIARAYGFDADRMRVMSKRHLWDIYLMAHGHRTWTDEHPQLVHKGRLLEYTPDTPLYPDDTNDETLYTCLKVVRGRFFCSDPNYLPIWDMNTEPGVVGICEA